MRVAGKVTRLILGRPGISAGPAHSGPSKRRAVESTLEGPLMSELVHDPVRRQRYRFSRTGEVLNIEIWADPGGEVPLHFHPRLEERFEVLAGRVRFTVAGTKTVAGPGDRATVPAGTRHRFENIGDEEAHMRVEVEPALDVQETITEAAALARAGKYTRRGIPRGLGAALDVAAFVERHGENTVIASPPPWLQRIFLGPLAALARRRDSD
jgi:quercetin dioxygenase-like cupin family protein